MSESIIKNTKEMRNLLFEKEMVFLDLETIGFAPNVNYGKIIEVAAIKVRDGKIVDRFESLINPQMKIPKKIQEVTHITDEMVKFSPTYEEILPKFFEFCGNMVVVGHNVAFDIRFLDYYSRLLGQKFEPDIIDTMLLAKYLHRDDKSTKCFRLEHLAGLYNIPNNNHHRAMNDVMVTYKLFNKLKTIIEKTYQEYLTTEKIRPVKKEVDMMDNVKLTKYSLWQKTYKGKRYSRLYVNLYYKGEYNYIFYDFIQKKWCVKELHFDMPTGYGDVVMRWISNLKCIPIEMCYKEETY